MLATTIEAVGTRAAEIAMATGAVLACPAVWRYFRNGKNGKGGDTNARLGALENKHDSGVGFDINICRKHGEGMAALEAGARAQWRSADRRLEELGTGIGELRDDVKDLTREVSKLPRQP